MISGALHPATPDRGVALRGSDGHSVVPGAHRWDEPADEVDARVLARAAGPVLDVGCGPGRHLVHLGERGIAALGIDITPTAVARARARGGTALLRSVFARVPAAGRWRSVVLLDGNVGIGGAPVALLGRVAELLTAGGVALVELAPPGSAAVTRAVRFELDGCGGPWFPFATLAADAVAPVAAAAGFWASEVWCDGGRWFAELHRSDTGSRAR